MDTKTLLIQISRRLFADLGYEAVGVQQIVSEGGVSKPTLYHHFGNKEGVLRAVLEAGLGELNEEIKRACHYEHDLHANLYQVLRLFLNFAKNQPQDYVLLRIASLGFWPDSALTTYGKPYAVSLQKSLNELFTQAVEDHGNMRGRETLHATNFLSYCWTYAQIVREDSLQIDDALIYQVEHSFAHGIFS